MDLGDGVSPPYPECGLIASDLQVVVEVVFNAESQRRRGGERDGISPCRTCRTCRGWEGATKGTKSAKKDLGDGVSPHTPNVG